MCTYSGTLKKEKLSSGYRGRALTKHTFHTTRLDRRYRGKARSTGQHDGEGGSDWRTEASSSESTQACAHSINQPINQSATAAVAAAGGSYRHETRHDDRRRTIGVYSDGGCRDIHLLPIQDSHRITFGVMVEEIVSCSRHKQITPVSNSREISGSVFGCKRERQPSDLGLNSPWKC